jgi:hypothetical protein
VQIGFDLLQFRNHLLGAIQNVYGVFSVRACIGISPQFLNNPCGNVKA